MEHEQLFPGRQTYVRYLHIAEAVAEDETQAAWDGLGGRLKALRREVVDVKADVKAGHAKLEAGQSKAEAEVKAGQSKAEAGQAEAKADMEEVKADMADVKALLEKLVAKSLQNTA